MTREPRLDTAQAKAVAATEGPLLLIAGPGSGKTHTLVERTVRLIVQEGVPADQILLSTFTEKAAAELVTRITNRLSDLGHDVNLAEMYIAEPSSPATSSSSSLTWLRREASSSDWNQVDFWRSASCATPTS